jgi:hypothetical protein
MEWTIIAILATVWLALRGELKRQEKQRQRQELTEMERYCREDEKRMIAIKKRGEAAMERFEYENARNAELRAMDPDPED